MPKILLIIIIAAVVAVGALFYFLRSGEEVSQPAATPTPEVQEVKSLGEKLYDQASNPGKEVPETNPFEKAKTNPFEETKTNPFKNVYTNPFD